MQNDIFYKDGSLEAFVARVCADERPAHIVVVGTKPDLIKQAPILRTLLARGEKAFLLHTGQHYDENLSGGIEKEFGLQVDVNLGVSGGTLSDNIARVVARSGEIFAALRAASPTLKILPYVHGDTTTCFAVTTAAFAHGIAVAHVEAGIRTMMITADMAQSLHDGAARDFSAWFARSADRANYTYGSHEPFPEQWNTRATDAGTGLFFAPVPLVAESLAREGYPASRIHMVGNTVVDAADFAGEIDSDIFERFPQLADGFVRVCVHRRENTESPERFTALFELVEILAEEASKPVLWILLPGTKAAIARHGLEERLAALRAHDNVVISDVWPKYSDVIAAMKRCTLCATDSGSMQEEMNMLGIPTATLRYGSDRPETFFARSNVVCPPISGRIAADICLGALANTDLFAFPALYGENVSEKIVDIATATLAENDTLVRLTPLR